MKKLTFLLILSLCCFAASAQPTSIGGITPGKTTLEEMKGLVKLGDGIGGKRYEVVRLALMEDLLAVVMIQNGVVYEVKIDTGYSDVLRQALMAKYGQPKIKVGGIRTVNCQNRFGATFKRYRGEESLLWPVKDGVQGGIEYYTLGECSEYIFERYALRHVAAVEAMKEKEEEEARRKTESQRNKLDGAL